MAEPLGEVCSVTTSLLRRGLGLQTSRPVNVFLPAKDRVLLEQASYTANTTEEHLYQQAIRNRDPNNRAFADLRFRPHGHGACFRLGTRYHKL